MESKVAAFKNKVYPSFMLDLIKGHGVIDTDVGKSEGGAGTRLRRLYAAKDEVKEALDILYKTDLEFKDTQPPKGLVRIQSASNTQSEKAAQEAAQEAAKATEEEKKKKKKKKDAETVFDRTNPTGHEFYFLFFGDIVELAARNAGVRKVDFSLVHASKPWVYDPSKYVDSDYNSADYPLTKIKILLGPLEYYNAEGKIKRINLAQFPISFNLFRAWFIKNIVQREVTRMSFHTFVYKIITDIIMPSLGGNAPVSHKPDSSMPSYHGLTLPGKQLESKVEVCGRQLYDSEELLPRVPVIDIEGNVFNQNYYRKASVMASSEAKLKTSFDYILYQITTSKDISQKNGNPLEDEKNGIPHFSIGSDAGMVKSVKFTKVNWPYRAEQLHAAAQSQDGDQLEQLIYPHHANIKLIGTPIWTPGMLFYVNPSLLGLGNVHDSNSLAHKLNIGGYNRTQKVSMRINKHGFETNLEGYYEGHGSPATG